MHQGDPVRGILRSTDASSGVAIPIYNAGSNTARTLASNEFLIIDHIHLSNDAGTGDHHVFFGSNMTPGTGSTIIRGSLPANGTLSAEFGCGSMSSEAGLNPRVIAASGTIDVIFTGRIVAV